MSRQNHDSLGCDGGPAVCVHPPVVRVRGDRKPHHRRLRPGAAAETGRSSTGSLREGQKANFKCLNSRLGGNYATRGATGDHIASTDATNRNARVAKAPARGTLTA